MTSESGLESAAERDKVSTASVTAVLQWMARRVRALPVQPSCGRVHGLWPQSHRSTLVPHSLVDVVEHHQIQYVRPQRYSAGDELAVQVENRLCVSR